MVTLANNYDRLGYYLVGWKKFYNKTLALMYAKQFSFEVRWIFNDSVYETYNWSEPVQETIESLYLRRAKQIREKYDYIILYYSGGADSHNVLSTFVNNNIRIDEIVMEIPELDRKNFKDNDTSSRNVYGEIDFVATPRLKELQHKLHPNTKIRYVDFSKPVLDLLKKDDWFETTPTNAYLTLGQIGRQSTHVSDKNIIELFDKGKKVCQLYGVDKPLVLFDGVDYYAYFSDASASHINPVIPDNIKEYEVDTEFFYWTPDIPEIVIKQAQMIKAACEVDVNKKQLWKKSLKLPIGAYRSVMHPIIYPGVEQPKFQADKPELKLFRAMDDWFWQTADVKTQDNFLYTIRNFLYQKIESKYCNPNDIDCELTAINTRFYKL
jgi:hypothetical protein